MAGTTGTATETGAARTVPMSAVVRGLLIAGGLLAIVLGAVVLFYAHDRLVDVTGVPKIVGWAGYRGAEVACLYGGTWCCVKGWNGRWDRAAG
ncbi:hypothetical protein GCM10010218_17170 [Streptomyces mashuensis]|uniref:Uncharacterized protein n=2 Tax=Streptomyces mashuensis TaxID=33904 RepID=A0A919EC66_9ACTN|nr:hypothetical protein GCM10010218_17170 [Streptomyces mashuensis]